MSGECEFMKEACAVFGVYNCGGIEVVGAAATALHAMQHRGQDGAGIAATDGGRLWLEKNIGLVSEALPSDVLQRIKGTRISIGHVRLASGHEAHSVLSTQPIVMYGQGGFRALALNGRLINNRALQRILMQQGQLFQTQTDSELMLHLIAQKVKEGPLAGVRYMMERVQGAYSVALMSSDCLIGARDPWGLRPLCLGKLGDSYMLSSESCAFTPLGASYVREILPGEIVVIDKHGLHSYETPTQRQALCSFEFVYFARSDSQVNAVGVYGARKRMGQALAQVAPVDADIVAGVPDSAIPAALGYAEASGIPYDMVLIKSPYTGRTFIQPAQNQRVRAVRRKLTVLTSQVAGRRIVLVDDSIVRGTNSIQLVRMLREAGAREVHLRISSPPVMYPCHFGINASTQSQLISPRFLGSEALARELGADSLAFLDTETLVRSIDAPCGLCTACFDADYPIPVRGGARKKSR